ncbi:hypothetical protein C0J52_02505, partial [Blattella germanica]
MSEIEELALKSKGCVVSYATSSYGSYEEFLKVIDGQRSTYWCTTGSYPQAFILSFPNLIYISSVKIRSYLGCLLYTSRCVYVNTVRQQP